MSALLQISPSLQMLYLLLERDNLDTQLFFSKINGTVASVDKTGHDVTMESPQCHRVLQAQSLETWGGGNIHSRRLDVGEGGENGRHNVANVKSPANAR